MIGLLNFYIRIEQLLLGSRAEEKKGPFIAIVRGFIHEQQRFENSAPFHAG